LASSAIGHGDEPPCLPGRCGDPDPAPAPHARSPRRRAGRGSTRDTCPADSVAGPWPPGDAAVPHAAGPRQAVGPRLSQRVPAAGTRDAPDSEARPVRPGGAVAPRSGDPRRISGECAGGRGNAMTFASVNTLGILLCLVASTAPIWGDLLRAMPGPIGRAARARRVRRMTSGSRPARRYPAARPSPAAGLVVVNRATGTAERVGRHAAA
jgi:hypothetical protein